MNKTVEQTTSANKDSRFFDGYVWCSDNAECRTGLCIKASSREEAAAKYVAPTLRYWNAHKPQTVWTMLNAFDVPTPIQIN